MPKSRAVLDKYTESYPESWARKLVWAYGGLKIIKEDVFTANILGSSQE